jgi:hypothetical protein
VLLRLFKLVFGSVTLFAENEPVLQPHLALIITSSIKYAGEVKVRASHARTHARTRTHAAAAAYCVARHS